MPFILEFLFFVASFFPRSERIEDNIFKVISRNEPVPFEDYEIWFGGNPFDDLILP